MPIALSWSRLSSYLECPLKFKSQYVDKNYPDDSDNPHFVRGKRIHKQMEDYILSIKEGSRPPSMSAEAKNGVPMVDKLFKNYEVVVSERQLATDMGWSKCDWFGKPTQVKYRCIVDTMAMRDDERLSIDWKTGKVRPYDDDHGQLHLSSAMIMSVVPNINKITNSYVFLDHKQSISITINRADVQKELDYFNKKYEVVNTDKEFKPTKHQYCGYCLIKDRCPLFIKQDSFDDDIPF